MISATAIKINSEEFVNDKSKFPNGCSGTILNIENCSKVDRSIMVNIARLT
jgi:hypothetical protein